MSILSAEPDMLTATANELASINAALRAGDTAAAEATTELVPAAADLVSMLTAAQFANHGLMYRAVSDQAAAAREQLAAVLGMSAGSYVATESANNAIVG